MLPILRDPGNSAYIREEAGKIMVGFFEPIAKPWGIDGIPDEFCFNDIQADWDRMMPYAERAMRRVPTLLEHGIKLFFCGRSPSPRITTTERAGPQSAEFLLSPPA